MSEKEMKGPFFHSVLLLIASAIFTPNSARAQTIAPPAIEWQKSFGGSSYEYGFNVLQTADGGYLIGGVSYSGSDGNKTSPSYGGYDYWVLRLDPNGNKLWERSYGGSGTDTLSDIKPAHDGGWMLAGNSDSPAGSGNKTSPLIGTKSYWLIHITDQGNVVWDKTYGVTNSHMERFCSVQPTIDGGYILGGSAWMSTFERQLADGDLWITHVDGDGNQLWNRIIAGNMMDDLATIRQTSDGGFMVGALSFSAAKEDKTSTNYSGTSLGDDYWLIRLDRNGQSLWDKSFGGSGFDEFRNIVPTPDGGFLMAGSSNSTTNGNKTSPYYGGGYQFGDFWLVRVNAEGEMLWNKSYGGTGAEILEDVQQTADGGILLVGRSQSGADGNKTSTNYGGEDGWVVRLASNGNKLWEQVFGNTNSGCIESIESVQQTRDGGYILVGNSTGGPSGNKTTPGFGFGDLWVIKLAPDALSAPPRLRLQPQSPAAIQTNGSRFFLSGVSNQLYRIEYSTDFRDWIPLQTNRASATELEVLDPAATNSVRRYYRAQPMPE